MSNKSYKSSLFKRIIDLGKVPSADVDDLVRIWRVGTGDEKAITLQNFVKTVDADLGSGGLTLTEIIAIIEGELNAIVHNSTTGKQGGDGTNFYHLSLSSFDKLETILNPLDSDWVSASASENNYWNGVAYGHGLFVAVGQDGTNRVMTSLDGITWTARSASENVGWLSVTFGNGLFVAVTAGGTNQVMTSPDGINWTSRSAAE